MRLLRARSSENAFQVLTRRRGYAPAAAPAPPAPTATGVGGALARRRHAKALPPPPRTIEGLPGPFVKGLAKALGLSTPWTPAFLCRPSLTAHLKKVAAGDALLAAEGALEALSGWELREAACARGLHVSNDVSEEAHLRRRLAEWLRLTESDSSGDGEAREGEMVLVPGRAKAAMLAVNVMASARGGAKDNELPRLLFAGPDLH